MQMSNRTRIDRRSCVTDRLCPGGHDPFPFAFARNELAVDGADGTLRSVSASQVVVRVVVRVR